MACRIARLRASGVFARDAPRLERIAGQLGPWELGAGSHDGASQQHALFSREDTGEPCQWFPHQPGVTALTVLFAFAFHLAVVSLYLT